MHAHAILRSPAFLLLSALLGGCASDARFPENPPLLTSPTAGPAQFGMRENDILLLVTFSGGGSRAAALAYGVLRELAETRIDIAGSTVRLVDEIDMISAVSGGSITAAYFGLYGDRLFSEFRARFLERDVESELASVFLTPSSLSRVSSAAFGRTEILAEYLDTALFDGQTLEALVDENPPYVEINATDLFKGSRFGFSPDQFALICSDINAFPTARAVAASSAVPFIFSPLTLVNRASTCDSPVPDWVTEGLKERDTNSRRYRAALTQRALLNSADHPYIHLLDGGLTDNLGLRAILDRIVINGGMWDTLQEYGHQDAEQVVFIIVDASAIPPTQWDKRAEGLPTTAILDAATTAPIASYNFETLQYVRRNMGDWEKEIARERCRSPRRCARTKFYMVDLSLESMADEELRNRLIGIPTRFRLKPNQVEELIDAGGELLRSNAQFRRLILDRS